MATETVNHWFVFSSSTLTRNVVIGELSWYRRTMGIADQAMGCCFLLARKKKTRCDVPWIYRFALYRE